MKKIAILVLTHKDYNQLDLLINQFDNKYYDVFVHADLKNINYESKLSNVIVLSDDLRVNVEWGHFSIVEAMLNLLKRSQSEKYSHYWFVSGQDLLIKDSAFIYENVIKEEINYINFMDDYYQRKFQYRNYINFNSFLRKNNLFSKIIRNIMFRYYNYKSKSKEQFYFGSQWQVLTNEFVKYLLDEQIIDPLVSFFSNKAIPDESFFQTAIMNSKFKNKINDYLLYVDWSLGSNSPKVLLESDYDKLLSSKQVVARKFDINIDEEIIRKVLGIKNE